MEHQISRARGPLSSEWRGRGGRPCLRWSTPCLGVRGQDDHEGVEEGADELAGVRAGLQALHLEERHDLREGWLLLAKLLSLARCKEDQRVVCGNRQPHRGP